MAATRGPLLPPAVDAAGLAVLALLFPRTLRALRDVAASLSATPSGGQGGAASRSACSETATPGAATPGAALPCNLAETEGMNTVPQAPVAALPPPRAPLAEVGTAQHAALLRWHNRRPLTEVVDDLQAHPRFPCVRGGAA
jgi:hypothetical protein